MRYRFRVCRFWNGCGRFVCACETAVHLVCRGCVVFAMNSGAVVGFVLAVWPWDLWLYVLFCVTVCGWCDPVCDRVLLYWVFVFCVCRLGTKVVVCFVVLLCVLFGDYLCYCIFFFLCVAGFGFIMFDLDLGFVELRERI